MHSLRDCCAAVLGCGYFADCAGSEEVVWADEVVGVPLKLKLVLTSRISGLEEYTMSSGSSGHNVTAPEPLCSMLLLISRMLSIRACFL